MWRYGTHTLGVRGTAVALSLTVHAGLFWLYGEEIWSAKAAAERPMIVARLSLPAPVETPTPPRPQVESLLPRSEPVFKRQAKPVSENVAMPKPKTEPVQRLAMAEMPKPLEQVSIPEAMPEPVQEHSREQVLEQRQEQTQQVSAPTQLALAQPAAPVSAEPTLEEVVENLQNYLAELRAAIAAQKQYPAMARRRGIEGEVKVSFTLLADGSVRDLRVSGGPRPLRNAARQAVHRAVKLPSPPAGVPLPMPVQYAMNFSLQ